MLNFVFCAPAVMGPVAGASDSPWMTEYGRWWLWFAYVASTPIEPFMQLHLLIATQRENRGSSKRIIDAGFGFAASMVILSFVVAAGMNYYAAGDGGVPRVGDVDARIRSRRRRLVDRAGNTQVSTT